MEPQEFSITVNIPSRDDFAFEFPQYGPRSEADGSDLFDLVMSPETFVRASVLSDYSRSPGVTAVADEAFAMRDRQISDTDKQYVGALMRELMTANGYEKTGRKGSISREGWNRGEIYRRADGVSAAQ